MRIKNDLLGTPIEVFTRHMFTEVICGLSRFLAQSDFTISEVAALHAVFAKESLSVQGLCPLLNLSLSAVSRLVSKLESRGLLICSMSNEDSRIKIIKCSAAGKKFLDQLSRERAAVAIQVIGNLDPNVSKKLLSALTDFHKGVPS
jgi:DNA-binding MarR family transcriptional regulator